MKKLTLLTIAALTLAANPYVYANRADVVIDNIESTGEEIRTAPQAVGVEPVRAALGTIYSPLGNTIKYTASVAQIAKDDVGKATLGALADSGKCANEAKYPNHLVVCGVELGGDLLTVTAYAPAKLGAATVYYVTHASADILDYWANAFGTCVETVGEVVGAPCKAMSFVLNGSGKVIKVTGVSLVEYVGNGANSVAYGISSFVDIPVSLFNGNLKGAGRAIIKSVHSLVCVVGDLTIVGLVGIIKTLLGEEHQTSCEAAAEIAERIDAGN